LLAGVRTLVTLTVAFGGTKDVEKPTVCYVIMTMLMLLADRGFANHEVMAWLRASGWHYRASTL